jgi:hypothetical protein
MTTFWAQCCTIVPVDLKADEEVVPESLARCVPVAPKKRSMKVWRGAQPHSVMGAKSKSAESRIRAQ